MAQEIPAHVQWEIMNHVRGDMVEAISQISDGIAHLQPRMTAKGLCYIAPKLRRPGFKKAADLKVWPNEEGKRPHFAWGKTIAPFIDLVRIFHPDLETEADAWAYCARLFEIKVTRGRAAAWSWQQATAAFRDGLERHAQHAEETRADFEQIARLDDEQRLGYALMPGRETFLSVYRDMHGEPVWFDEHELTGKRRKFMRCCVKTGEGKGRFVGGLHPWIPGVVESGPVAIITVHALEADQLRQCGAQAYAVPSTWTYPQAAQLKALAQRFKQIIFMGPAGPDGLRWARQAKGAAEALGIEATAVFHWPPEAPNRYTPSRVILDGGKLCVDFDGAVTVVCSPALLEPHLLKADAQRQKEMERFTMTPDLITEAPNSILPGDAKRLYGALLSRQGAGDEVRIDRVYLHVIHGLTKQRVDRALGTLQSKGLIAMKRRGVYHVHTLRELAGLPIAQALFDARVRAEEEIARLKQKGSKTARIIPMHADELTA